jgi:HK97 family phage major capsid protein
MNAHVRSAIELPRASRPVFNMAGEVADIAALSRQFEAHNSALNARILAMESEIGRLNTQNAAFIVSGGGTQVNGVLHPDIKALGTFARGQMDEIRASMTVGSDPDGGYTVLPEVEKSIRDIQQDISPMRQLATVRPISSAEYKVIVNPGVIPAGWTGETDSRPQTSSPKLVEIKIPAHEIYCMPAASQSTLDDSFVDVGAWLQNQIGVGISIKEGSSFISGDGVMKPWGILSYGAESAADFARSKWNIPQYIPTLSTTPTDVQLADALVAMATTLRMPYRIAAKNPTWIMSRSMALRVRQCKDSQNRYIWTENDRVLTDDIQPLLLGFPIAYSEDLPAPTANSFSVALGAWGDAYTIVDRFGTRVVRDNLTAKPYILFYTTKRIGGGVIDFNAYKLLKWSAS